MCGIVGIISKYSSGFFQYHEELFTKMLQMDAIRGDDSTGVFGVDKAGNFDLLKGNAGGYVFTNSSNYQKFAKRVRNDYHIVIGHNRKATVGTITPENAHPFHEGKVILVHNGTIWNQDELNKEVSVDSHAIAHALNEHDAVKALGSINGAYALVWYNIEDKLLNVVRNNQRPLALLEYSDFWVISSEAGLPLWLNLRENRKHVQLIDVPINTILTFPLNILTQQPTQVSYEEYKAPALPPYNYVPRWVNNHTASPPSTVSAGDRIQVVFEDDRGGIDGGTTFIGHPVISNVMDKNIVVHYYTNDPEFTDIVCKHEFFTCKIVSIGAYQGIPLWYVNEAVPILNAIRTFNNEYVSQDEIKNIISMGCQRCSGAIIEQDIKNTIVKKKSDNTYRIICNKCIESSVNSATTRPKGTLTVVH